jgi:hypothetical protein
MSVFNEEFLSKIPDQPILALQSICKKFSEVNSSIPSEKEPDNIDFYLEALALLETIGAVAGLTLEIPIIESDKVKTISKIKELYASVSQKVEKDAAVIVFEKAKKRFAGNFGFLFSYEFSEGDLTKLQSLLDELRKQIQKAKGLDADHRRRLLSRLEQLQSELHKRISDLDRFWGLVGEAGVVVGKLGEQAKPIVECIKLIADIVWSTQARAEELPSTMPNILQLGSDDSTKESKK